ncbi:AGE family epimerase/isomerase [uncultured Nocardioides sp.]|uniref:AGE family epimerase/isomerase n=1 Tax=uncultured Nocardioides sp. TaxID=198441 RepID=UPI00261F249D|nr:AGE family epimerase/isomerase [uncultured Nocardioides sp.]
MATAPESVSGHGPDLPVAEARLVALLGRARDPAGGFGWLGDDGRLLPGRAPETWITARMTHVAALAHLRGHAGADDLLDHGVRALRTLLRDHENDGWLPAVGATTADKEAYQQAFVVLAGASATGAGHPDGPVLLADALRVADERFWDADQQMPLDTWDATFTRLDDYRGGNAAMHTVEALTAAYDVTGEDRWLDRALAVATRLVDGVARAHAWRLPEHFDPTWVPDLDHHVDEPAHPFRPYGVTVGHLLEWSRLLLGLRAASAARPGGAPDWLLPASLALYDAAVARGWAVDGASGFVYTTDFADRPVVRLRMHWVLAEALGAAWARHVATGEDAALADHRRWWGWAVEHLVAPADGSWRHELDEHNRPSAYVWTGRPDLYHAYQATVLPLLPAAPSLVGAVLASRRRS